MTDVSTVTIMTTLTAVTLRVMHEHGYVSYVIVTLDLLTCGMSRPHPFFDWVYSQIQDLLQHSHQKKQAS